MVSALGSGVLASIALTTDLDQARAQGTAAYQHAQERQSNFRDLAIGSLAVSGGLGLAALIMEITRPKFSSKPRHPTTWAFVFEGKGLGIRTQY